MWPFENTYIVNRVESPISPSNHKELAELAHQTEKLTNATRNLTDSLNQDRITISNCRYAELINKDRLLKVLVQYVNNYFTLIGNLKKSDNFKKFYKNPYIFIDIMNQYNIYCEINNDYCVNIDSKSKKINILKSKNPFIFIYPEYIPYEEGNTVIIGDKYNRYLRHEILLKEYIKIVENIESLSYQLFGDIRTSDMFHFLMNDENRNEYEMLTVFYFDENFKKSKNLDKYVLSIQKSRIISLELKINI